MYDAPSRVYGWVSRHRELLTVSISGSLIAAAWILRAIGRGTPVTFMVLMTVAAVVAGISVAREAIGRLLAKEFSIPLLVTIAAVGALWIGEAWEAAAVTFLYVLGGYLEGLTLARTRAALRTLIDLAPRTGRVKRADGVHVIDASEISKGDVVVVLPGDRVPVDGMVLEGRASLDTSPLTGEPLPQEVGPGDSVLGGSVSQVGFLEVEAQKVGVDTTFSRILYLVAEAQDQKPKVQRMLDRFAAWYTPLIISLSVALYLLTRDIELSLTFLVIGCPGALVVASPVAVVAGLGHAARKGILIKGGERLERIGKVDVVAFDKTGTLTLGRPRVNGVEAFDQPSGGTAHQIPANEQWVTALAAAAELRSEHHLAKAILDYAKEQGIDPVEASDWALLPGLGAVAETDQGTVLVGNRRLLSSRGVSLTAAQEGAASRREATGETVAFVAFAGAPVGLIGIVDPLRPGARGLVSGLKQAGVRKTIMLTGDNEHAARRVAALLGIDEVRAGLLPEEKVQAIRELQAAGHVVAMVGDGVNDAPALATADVSIAMGASGTEVAVETADIALMTDRLERVPESIGLSRRILSVVRQNVVFAVAVVALLLAGVVGRLVFLAGGMLIHEASVMLVILNGMRLLRSPSA
ncbi:MAG TPA: cation-translocating P-type ATPase [Firmicutes bacterium]|nr:cation-translocating P-type ATPase [Candidatus Fermentithermobacillaceae bacterium]